MSLPLTDLYDIWQDEGLPVKIGNPTWQTWGRPFPFELKGSLAHHTASPLWTTAAGNRYVVTNGNSVAPGPIANALLQRNLDLEVIAAGRCNHGGAGWWPLGQDTANRYGFSLEAVNDGVGEYWQSEFVEIMARAYASVHRAYSLPLELAWTHRAYAPSRKIDPAGPAAFRNDRPGSWTNTEWQGLVRGYSYKPPPLPTLPPIHDQEGEESMERIIYPVPGTDGKKWWTDSTPHLVVDGAHVRRATNADYDLSNVLKASGGSVQIPQLALNSADQYNYLISIMQKGT